MQEVIDLEKLLGVLVTVLIFRGRYFNSTHLFRGNVRVILEHLSGLLDYGLGTFSYGCDYRFKNQLGKGWCKS